MSFRDVVSLASSDNVFSINYNEIHNKVFYIERAIPLHISGIKASYCAYKLLSDDNCYLDKQLKQIFLRLTRTISFLYGKKLIDIHVDEDKDIPQEILLKMLSEVEELERVFNDSDFTIDFRLVEQFIKTDYESEIKEVIMAKDEAELESFESKDYTYLAYLKSEDKFINVFSSREDEKKFKKNKTFVCVVPAITGNYQLDKSLLLIELAGAFEAQKSINNYKNEIITTDNLHIEIAHFYNYTTQMLIYLKNSHSLRKNELFVFDKMEYDGYLRVANSLIERTKTSLLNILQNK